MSPDLCKARPVLAAATTAALMVTLAASQSLQVSPSFGNPHDQHDLCHPYSSSGGVTFPLFSPSVLHDQWTVESSSRQETIAPPPNQINKSPGYSALSTSFQPLDYADNSSTIDYAELRTYGETGIPVGDNTAASSSYQGVAEASRNHSSRFFTVNTNRKTLDLGLSFTVPFLSIPMLSLLSLGETLGASTTTALNSLLAINWPSVIIIGVAIACAALLLPQLAAWLASLTSGTGSTYGNSYGRNIDRDGSLLPVEPFTAILNQLDDALAQYDLDSTSCMQRAVCTYVAESELSVKTGDADSNEMIVAGLARSTWLQTLVGKTSLTEAVELGRSGANCQLQYPKCPFSLAGVLRFLATYSSLTS